MGIHDVPEPRSGVSLVTPFTRTSLVVLFVATTLSVGTAFAQPAQAQAEHLFREGKRLMSEGNIAAACDAFEGSYAKDPAVSTLLNLADCREKNQQYASAWGYFIEAGRKTRNKPDMAAFNKTAEQRAAGVEPRLSYLIINVPDEARVEGLTITRNGAPVDVIEWNRDIPVDGGTYRIEGKAPAFEPWSTTITVGNAKDKQSVNVPRFRNALPGANVTAETPTTTEVHPWYRDPFGWTLVGVGVAASAGGGALLMKASNAEEDANSEPVLSRRQDLRDKASSQRLLGGVTLGVGSALIVAGAVKLWARPARVEVRPGPGVVGLAMSLRF